jgi:hypothetical protein
MLTRAAKALTLSQNLLRARGVFSSNEQLEDVSTQGLAFMTVDFVAAEVAGRLKTDGRKDRLARLRQAKVRGSCFLLLLAIAPSLTIHRWFEWARLGGLRGVYEISRVLWRAEQGRERQPSSEWSERSCEEKGGEDQAV